MRRYIDKSILLKELNEAQIEGDEYYKGLGKAKRIACDQPTADVQEVKHAKDLQSERAFSGWTFECSRCHLFDDDTYYIVSQIDSIKYCPNCGAKMDLEDNE